MIIVAEYFLSSPYPETTYLAVHNYPAHSEGDLELKKGDLVTILEAPYGGDWWKGRVGEPEGGEEGWFPKSYVRYFDLETEKKKKMDGECVCVCVCDSFVRV